MILRIILIMLVCLVGGCGSKQPEFGHYSIGRDPTWFPLNFKLQTANINAFTNSLIAAIARTEHVPMRILDVDWNTLYTHLEERRYAGAFTSFPKNPQNLDRYTFSEPFLLLGPVLVVSEDSSATSLADLDDALIGINQFDDSVLIVQKYPTLQIKLYQNMPMALEDLAAGRIDAVLISTLEAQALVPNLYPGMLKIVTGPLSDKALRLITLKGENEQLIKHFNRGLKDLHETGQYASLREKFGVN